MMRRFVRLLGTLMIVAGIGTLAWAGLVWQWQDPFTYVYTHYQQHRLAAQYEKRLAHYRPVALPAHVSLAVERRSIAREAARYRHERRRGDALGRMKIPRLGLNIILVNGTDHDTLTRGPGRDLRTFMPGQGQLVYVAGHRTTYSAPFSHIDSLHAGDRVRVELPYATFVYRITGHRIVRADDLAVLKSRGREELILQACHPRFFATHRYLAYAKPVEVIPRSGPSYAPAGEALAAAG
jgi:sortase A